MTTNIKFHPLIFGGKGTQSYALVTFIFWPFFWNWLTKSILLCHFLALFLFFDGLSCLLCWFLELFLANWHSKSYHCYCADFSHCFQGWPTIFLYSLCSSTQQELQQKSYNNVYFEKSCFCHCYHHDLHAFSSILPWWNSTSLQLTSCFWTWNIP